MIPIILGSDETLFSVLGGDKKGWPMLLSICNILANIRNSPSAKAFLELASLPIVPKKPATKGKNSTYTLTGWALDKNDAIQETLAIILKDLPRLYAEGMEINCSDGKKRVGHPILAGWIADYKEYSNIFQIKQNSCVNCEIPQETMGDNIAGPARDFALYKEKYLEWRALKVQLDSVGVLTAPERRTVKATSDVIVQWFQARRVLLADRLISDLPGMDHSSVWKPDILHTLYAGMGKYLFLWIEGFLKSSHRLHAFNERWLMIPRYNDLTAPSKSHYQLTQRTGKEWRYGLRVLVPVLASALASPASTTEAELFAKVLQCTRYLVDFVLLCHYKVHTLESVNLLQHYLDRFHELKSVFNPWRAGAAVTAAIAAAEEELRNMGDTLTDEARTAIIDTNTGFAFPKMHVLMYFPLSIILFGHLHNWSTEIVETLLKAWKVAYALSSKNEATKQVLCTFFSNPPPFSTVTPTSSVNAGS